MEHVGKQKGKWLISDDLARAPYGVAEPMRSLLTRKACLSGPRQVGHQRIEFRGLAALVKPYRARTIVMFVSMILAVAASLAPPLLAGLAVNDVKDGDMGGLTWVVIAFLVAAIVNWGAAWLETYLVNWVGQRALQDLRIMIFGHLQRLSIGFYSRNRAGVLISRLTNDVEALSSLVTDTIITLFSASLTLLGTIVILVILDVKLALMTFLAPGPLRFVYVILGAVVSVVAMLGTAHAVRPFGVSALTFPFVITTWLLLLAAHAFSAIHSGLPLPGEVSAVTPAWFAAFASAPFSSRSATHPGLA